MIDYETAISFATRYKLARQEKKNLRSCCDYGTAWNHSTASISDTVTLMTTAVINFTLLLAILGAWKRSE